MTLNTINEVTVPTDLVLKFFNDHTLVRIVRKADNAIVAQLPDHLARNMANDLSDYRAKGFCMEEATYRTITDLFHYQSLVEKQEHYGFNE